MPRVLKLRKGWEFRAIFRTGTRTNGELVRLLFVRDDKDTGTVRYGVAVGKKQGKAHVRVRGRRILREAFRPLSDKITPGISMVLTLKNEGLSAKTQDIQRDLERILKRKKLFAK